MKRAVLSLSVLLLVGGGCMWNQSGEETGRYGAPQEDSGATAEDRTVAGTVTSVNVEGVAADGPAIVTVATATEGNVEIHVPSFGINLCAASASIADVYAMKAGDKVEARGSVSEDGSIVPCESSEHYLRVVAK